MNMIKVTPLTTNWLCKTATVCALALLFLITSQPVKAEISSTATSSVATSTMATSSPELKISFLYPPSVITANSDIYARTNTQADSVNFYITGNKSAVEVGKISQNSVGFYFNYSFNWDISNYTDGDYTLRAEAIKGESATSTTTLIKINRATSSEEINNQASSTVEMASSSIAIASSTEVTTVSASSTEKTIGIELIEPEMNFVATSSAIITTKSQGPVKKIDLINLKDQAIISTIEPNSINYTWQFIWDTSQLGSSTQQLQAFAWDASDNKIESGKISINIQNASSTLAASSTDIATSSQIVIPDNNIEEPALPIKKADESKSATDLQQQSTSTVLKTTLPATATPQSSKIKSDLDFKIGVTVAVILICLAGLFYLRKKEK